MTTATMSLAQLYKLCLDKAASLPVGEGYNYARNRLYEKAYEYGAQLDELNGADDNEGSVGCQVDQSWL